ncbi:MAG: hypothetical protein GX628_02945 [Clostridiales bacterium]|nr:hypothetical protein [Clostridiales bacterium]
MKAIKQFLALALTLTILACLPQVIFAAPKVGDVVDHVLHTDIITYINGLPIRSYNIKGNTAVIVEDLSNYGFYVVWYGVERELTVRRLESVPVVGGYKPEKNTHPIGSKAMPVYFTDIVTYLDGVKVDSFNVGGSTIIYVDDLAKFYAKEYVWDPKARTLSLTLKGAPTPDLDSDEKPGSDEKPVSESSGVPVIEKQPEDCNVKEGDYAVFEVKASGEGLKYKWQRDERAFDSNPESAAASSWNWVDLYESSGISGAAASKLTILADIYAIRSGSYRCVITDKNGKSVTSDYASIIPISPGINITVQPKEQTKKAGEIATLYVGAEGLDLKYQWQELVGSFSKEEGVFMSYEYRNIKDGTNYSGAQTNTLSLVVNPPPILNVILPGSLPEYICLITDRYGLTVSSSPAKVNSLLELKITEQPQNVVKTENVPAEIHVKATGDSLIFYRWQFLWLNNWRDVPDKNPQFAGFDTPTLTWYKEDGSGTFKFRCVISGQHSEPVISNEVSITYDTAPKDYNIRNPKSVRAKFNERVSFDFDFIGLKVNSLECVWQRRSEGGNWVDLPDTNSKKIDVFVGSESSGCWFRCKGKVNGHNFATMPAKLEGTLRYKRDNLTQTKLEVTKDGTLYWIDMRDYVLGEGLTFEWQGRKNLVPENLYIIEPEYRVEKYGSVVHIVRTEVNGSKLGISTTGEYGSYKVHTGGDGWLQGRDDWYIYSLTLYTEADCIITDRYGGKLTFHVKIEYINP